MVLQLLIFASLFIVSLLFLVRSRRSRRLPLPPGPAGTWLWGNNIPPTSAFEYYEQLAEVYGPVVSLKRGSQIVVVIGRKDAADDIMERCGSQVADRPVLIPTDAVSGGMRLLFMDCGERFRKFRRALHRHLNTRVISAYYPFITRHSRNMIRDILRNPGDHQLHTRKMSCSTILSMTYGKSTSTSLDDPEVKSIEKVLWRIGQIVRPGSYLVELFPFLRFIPWYMKKFSIWHQEELSLFESQINEVKESMVVGTAEPSFTKDILARQANLGLSDEEVAYLSGSMFGAGSGSTAAAVSVTILAAATHPAEQAIVQEELDRVVGQYTPPSFDNLNELPRLAAFVIESYRWRPVAGGGTPHRATSDIIWKNYCIPANSIVIGNHWSITRDPVHFPDPEKFRPSRWLDTDGRLIEDLTFFNFGFGRRICPGQHVAHSTILLNTALLLWSFRISEDEKYPINPSAFSGSLVMAPAYFTPEFIPRTSESELLSLLDSA